MKLLAVAASHRPHSFNRTLLRLAARLAATRAAMTEMDYGAFDAPPYDDALHTREGLPEGARRFVDALAASDGLMLAAPEYNWSFPGSLKNLIDWASCATPHPFAGKTALLLSATPSMRGGVAGLLQLRVPLEALGMIVFPRVFALGQTPASLGDGQVLKDPSAQALLEETVSEYLDLTARLISR